MIAKGQVGLKHGWVRDTQSGCLCLNRWRLGQHRQVGPKHGWLRCARAIYYDN